MLPKNNNLDYMTDPTFRNNRMFVISFKICNNDSARYYFDKYYAPLVEFKDFNAQIDKKPFFDQLVKNKQLYEKLVEMSRNNDYAKGNLLDRHITKIAINRRNTSIPQIIKYYMSLVKFRDFNAVTDNKLFFH